MKSGPAISVGAHGCAGKGQLKALKQQQSRRLQAFRKRAEYSAWRNRTSTLQRTALDRQSRQIQKHRSRCTAAYSSGRASVMHGSIRIGYQHLQNDPCPYQDLLRNRPEHQFELDPVVRQSLGKPGWDGHPLRASTFAAFGCYNHLRDVQRSQLVGCKKAPSQRPQWNDSPLFPRKHSKPVFQPSKDWRAVEGPARGGSRKAQKVWTPKIAWNSDTHIPPVPKERPLFLPGGSRRATRQVLLQAIRLSPPELLSQNGASPQHSQASKTASTPFGKGKPR